jgi:hypothetical protein
VTETGRSIVMEFMDGAEWKPSRFVIKVRSSEK